MYQSTPGKSVSTFVRTGLIGTLACAASLPSQNASKSAGRGVERPIFVGIAADQDVQTYLGSVERDIVTGLETAEQAQAGADEPSQQGAAPQVDYHDAASDAWSMGPPIPPRERFLSPRRRSVRGCRSRRTTSARTPGPG